MKVVVVNQYNSDNIGDKLIGRVLQEFFENYNHDVCLGGYAQTAPQEIRKPTEYGLLRKIKTFLKRQCPNFMKYFVVYRKNILLEIKRCELSHANALVIGGGQLIKHSSVFVYCFYLWCRAANYYGVPIYIHGVGVDDNLNAFEKYIYKKGFSVARYVNCRDQSSFHNIKEIFHGEVKMSPDVVFSLNIKKIECHKNMTLLMPYNYKTAKKHFHTLKTRRNYYFHLKSKLGKDAKVILTATTSSDLEECYKLKRYLDKNQIKNKVINSKNELELLNLYYHAKEVHTGRMHAMILGLLSQTSIVPIQISPKVETFCREFLDNNSSIYDTAEQSLQGMEELLSVMEKI